MNAHFDWLLGLEFNFQHPTEEQFKMFYKLALPWINTWWCGRGAEGRKFPLWNAVEFVCRQQNKGWIIKVHHPLPILWAKGQVSLDAFECLAVSSPGWHPPLEWVPGSHSPGAGTSAVASLSLHNPLQAKQRWESREMVWILHKSKVSLVLQRAAQKRTVTHHLRLLTLSENTCSEWNKNHNGVVTLKAEHLVKE